MAATVSSEIKWYVARDGQQYGPLTEEEFRHLEHQSHLLDGDLIWNESLSDWKTYQAYRPQAEQHQALPLQSLKNWGLLIKLMIYANIAISTAFAIASFVIDDNRLVLSFFFWPLLTSQASVGVVGGIWLRRALRNLKGLTIDWLPPPSSAFLFAGPQTVFVIASALEFAAKTVGHPLGANVLRGPLFQWPMLIVIICSWFLFPFLLQRVHRLSTRMAEGFTRTRSSVDVWVFFACWLFSSFGFKEQTWGWGGAVLCACISNAGTWLLRGLVEDISNSHERVIQGEPTATNSKPRSGSMRLNTVMRYAIAVAVISFVLLATFNDLPLVKKYLAQKSWL